MMVTSLRPYRSVVVRAFAWIAIMSFAALTQTISHGDGPSSPIGDPEDPTASADESRPFATTITILNSGVGTLDGFLSPTDGTITSADLAGNSGSISRAALQGVNANVNISITATTNIVVNDLTSPLALQTDAAHSAQFSAAGSFTFTDINDSITTAGGDLRVLAVTSATVGGLSSSGGDIEVQANNISLATAMNAGAGTATLRPSQAGVAINLGGADAAGTLGITAAELNLITAGVIVVGRNDVGNASGTISVTGAINPTNTNQLELVTGGLIDHAGGTITETRLGLTGGLAIGGVADPLVTTVSNVEATTPQGGIFVSNTGTPLTIGGVNGTLTGVRTTQNSITITNNNSITIGATSAEGISIGGVTGNIFVQATGAASDINVNASVTNSAPGGTITIIANEDVSVTRAVSTTNGTGAISLRSDNDNSGTGNLSSTLTGTVTSAGGSINISASSTVDGDTVTIGGAVNASAGAVAIGSAGDVNINAGIATSTNTMTVGADANSNGNGAFMSGPGGTLTTTTGPLNVRGNDVTVGAGISSTSGNITITTDGDNNFVGSFSSSVAGTLSTSGGGITIHGGTDDAHANAATIGGAVAIAGGAGSVQVSFGGNVNVNAGMSVTGTGGIFITADSNAGGAGAFTNNGSGTLSTGGGAVSITAADVVLAGTINATTANFADVFLQPSRNAAVIHLGTNTAFGLSDAELDLITASAVVIGTGSNTGGIQLDGQVSLAPAKVTTLELLTDGAGGSITDQTAGEQTDISVQDLMLLADSGIGTGVGGPGNLDTAVTNLAINNTGTVTGSVNIANTSALLNFGFLSTGFFGFGGITNNNTNAAAAITITNTNAIDAMFNVITAGTGDINLDAGTGFTLDASRLVRSGTSAGGGNVTIRSNVNNVNGTADIILNSGSQVLTRGTIILNANPDGNAVGGGIGMATGILAGPTNTLANSITLNAANNVGLGALSAATTVSVTSSNGAILDTNDVPSGTPVQGITANQLALSASTGIGVFLSPVPSAGDAPLETQVNSLEAQTTTGGIAILNGFTSPTALSIGGVSGVLSGMRVTGASGPISITNNGGISIITNGEIVKGPGNLSIVANGATADLITGGNNSIANGAIVSTGGLTTMQAGRDVLVGNPPGGVGNCFGDVQGGGSVVLTAGRHIVIDCASFVDAHGSGTLTATAGGNISLQQTLQPGVQITSQGGAIGITTGPGGIFTNNAGNTGVINSNFGGAGNGPVTISADDINLLDPITAGTGLVTLKQKTGARPIDLGTNTAGKVGLTNTELNFVTAGTLAIGDINSGSVTVSAAIVRAAATTINIASGANIDIAGASINSNGGAVNLQPGTNVFPSNNGVDVTTGAAQTLSLGSGKDLRIIINNTTIDTGYTQLNVAGRVNLNGAALALSGPHVPAVGQTFTIVNNDSTDAITGTFAGLPEGAQIPNFLGSNLSASISYVGGSGNDAVLTVTGPSIDGTGAGDTFVVSKSGVNTVVTRNAVQVFNAATASVSTITINGLGGNDSLTVDSSNGNPYPSNGIFFDGGTENDSITLLGGSWATEVSTPTGPGSGNIAFTGGPSGSATLNYSNIEPITDTNAVTTLVLSGTSGADTINVVNGPGGTTQVNSGGSPTFELWNFANKTSVNVNGQGGLDSFTVNNPNPAAGLAVLSLLGGSAADSFNISAAVPGITMVIDGLGGVDTVSGPNTGATWNVSSSPGTGNIFALASFSNIENIAGGSGTDTVAAPSIANTWNITSANAGNITGLMNFTGMENLGGGSDVDNFVFANGASVAGTIDGGGGLNTLDYSAYTPPVAVNLGLNAGGGGAFSATLDGDQENPRQMTTASGTATFTYNNLAHTIDIHVQVSNLAPGSVTGYELRRAPVNGTNGPVIVNLGVVFGIGSLTPSGNGFTFDALGVPVPDAQEAAVLGGLTYINFETAAAPFGLIRGQIFPNSAFVAASGTGTGTGGIANISNVKGGSGPDSLVGTPGVNTINGNAGNDTIVGGPSGDTLSGGADTDVIVWSNGDGSDLMDGDAGNDTVQVNGSTGLTGDNFLLQSNGTRVRLDRINLGLFNLNIGTTESLVFNGINGDDTFGLNSMVGVNDLSAVFINGFDGNDTFNIVPAPNGATRAYTVRGGLPTSVGDVLNIDTTGVADPVLNINSNGDGTFTSSSHQTINIFGIEPAGNPQGFEGDVAPRPNGDGKIQSDDVIQVQRFQIGLDGLVNGSDEFMRADSAPIGTHGDGAIQSDDVVQTQRYQIGLDPMQNTAGPAIDLEKAFDRRTGRESPASPANAASGASNPDGGNKRMLRVVASSTRKGQLVAEVVVDAVGDESAYGFTLAYDDSKLGSPVISAGTSGSSICSTFMPGKISCSVTGFADDQPGSSTESIGEIPAGHDQVILRISFTPAVGAIGNIAPISLIRFDASNDRAQGLEIETLIGAP